MLNRSALDVSGAKGAGGHARPRPVLGGGFGAHPGGNLGRDAQPGAKELERRSAAARRVDHRLDAGTAGVPEHHDVRYAEDLDAELEGRAHPIAAPPAGLGGRGLVRRHEVGDVANREEVPGPGTADQRGIDPRVGASDDHRLGMLRGGQPGHEVPIPAVFPRPEGQRPFEQRGHAAGKQVRLQRVHVVCRSNVCPDRSPSAPRSRPARRSSARFRSRRTRVRVPHSFIPVPPCATSRTRRPAGPGARPGGRPSPPPRDAATYTAKRRPLYFLPSDVKTTCFLRPAAPPRRSDRATSRDRERRVRTPPHPAGRTVRASTSGCRSVLFQPR